MTEFIKKLIASALEDRVFPGGVLLASYQGRVVVQEVFGVKNIYDKAPVNQDTFYDLASLTKPLATTLAVLHLCEKSKLHIRQSLGDVLEETRGTDKAGITIEQLLAHRSGMPDYRPYYKALFEKDEAERGSVLQTLLIREPLQHPIGKETLYSDLGFMLLNRVVERIAGVRLNRLVEKEIYESVGIKDLFFPGTRKPLPDQRCAATEVCPFRKALVQGVVHDENAYAVGGVDGQAGLFGTAPAVHALLIDIVSAYHDRKASGVLSPGFVRQFLNHGSGKNRALGFDRPTQPGSSSGSYFSANSVGHLGFTGTSFWVDLDRDVIVILLTNRVHPSRDNEKIKAFRPLIHDAVMAYILQA